MVLLGILFLLEAAAMADATVLSFEPDHSEPAWFAVNDGVMGGRSSGSFELVDGQLRFSGVLNTRGGGFASIRTEPWAFGFSELHGFRVRLRGDGRRYRLRLGAADTRVGYLAEFTTRPNQWQEIELRLSDFQASFRGRRLELPAIAPASISSIGFLIADRRDGPFVLEVDWIEALATDPGVEISVP